jgi:hypothetical protein
MTTNSQTGQRADLATFPQEKPRRLAFPSNCHQETWPKASSWLIRPDQFFCARLADCIVNRVGAG